MPTVADIRARLTGARTDINEGENAISRGLYDIDRALEDLDALEAPDAPAEPDPAPTDPEPDPVDPEPSPADPDSTYQGFLDSFGPGVHELTHVTPVADVAFDPPAGLRVGGLSAWLGGSFLDGRVVIAFGGHGDGNFTGMLEVDIVSGDYLVTKPDLLTREKAFTWKDDDGQMVDDVVTLPARDDYLTRHTGSAIEEVRPGVLYVGGYAASGDGYLKERAAGLPNLWQFTQDIRDADGYVPRAPLAWQPGWNERVAAWSATSGYVTSILRLPGGRVFVGGTTRWFIDDGQGHLLSQGGADPGWSCCYHPGRNAVYGITWGKDINELMLDSHHSNVIANRRMLDVTADAGWTYECGIAPWGDDLVVFNPTLPVMHIIGIDDKSVREIPNPFPIDRSQRVFNRFRMIEPGAYLFWPTSESLRPHIWKPAELNGGAVEPEPDNSNTIPPGDVGIAFDNIDGLIEQGWLPDYRDTGKSYRAVEMDAERTDFHGAGGERNEIGLMTEEMAAYIATRDRRYRDHVIRLADVITPAMWQDFAQVRKDFGIEYAHTPGYWYEAFLLTGNRDYIFADEQIYRGFMQWQHNGGPDSPESLYARDMQTGYNGRHWAWMMRNLARLARLQEHGLTKYTYYRDAMRANLQYIMTHRVLSDDPITQEWRVIGWNKGAMNVGQHSYSMWQESMIGQVLGHMILLGHEEWRPVAEWHLEQLTRRIEYWGMKGIDGHGLRVEAQEPHTMAGRQPYGPEQITETYLNWPRDRLIPLDMRDTEGHVFTYWSRAQYAYGWAAVQAQANVPGARELAEAIDAAIVERGDVRDFKNTPEVANAS